MALCPRLIHPKSACKSEQSNRTRQPASDACNPPSSIDGAAAAGGANGSLQPRHQLSTVHPFARSGTTLANRVLSLFRSRSDPTVASALPPSPPRRRRSTGPPRSSSASPCSSGASIAGNAVRRNSSGSTTTTTGGKPVHHRRRYQRVVRNENAKPPDLPDDNPFVIRKFTQEYLTNYYADKKPVAAVDSSSTPNGSGSHPILKHRSPAGRLRNASGSGSGASSTDDEATAPLPLISPTSFASSSSAAAAPLPLTPTNRHAKFRDIVEIVEYQMRDRVAEKQHSRTHSMPLNDSDDEQAETGRETGLELAAKETRGGGNDPSIVEGTLCAHEIERSKSTMPPPPLLGAPQVTSGVLSPLSSPGHRCRPPLKHLRLDECDEDDGVDGQFSAQLESRDVGDAYRNT